MLIDTHCHLDFEDFNDDRAAVLKRARAAGVRYFVNTGSNLESSRKSVELASLHDDIAATVGIHPHYADQVDDDLFAELEGLAREEKVVAIGEVGLDYVKSTSTPGAQKELFARCIELSKRLTLPLVIHNREAGPDIIRVLDMIADRKVLSGVMHCFSGDRTLLAQALERGLYISCACNVTFKNAHHLREIVRSIPHERLLLETDAPFLAPQKYRGQRNEPAYITELCDLLSELLGLSREEVERITGENAKRLFGITR
jgi:TatD DNase family protein